ncbi:cellulose biosynthesis cyclic di-GMP-binding regulatory protein BcsB [Stenotrophomonas sp. MMGLT7]|uniref:cellulose biosynthesis cyclic di-GMP-binding regulatory protein BcsB n=1 Tax=Stenotrophomonas sp. MMGLT7 TaxID=2901227 RepID=UPI001E5ACD63|nr:cellulose biosynthesis cyclic di-GMP-binding regulatory protein BcsB [Stenotrophomonas sp. MMGLT7]MCD7099992.1 cellulose biosynthesis cyclic di-GMP-binding regulatory protein BcsB [Stenotrophomonas sp. MMGLT7]
MRLLVACMAFCLTSLVGLAQAQDAAAPAASTVPAAGAAPETAGAELAAPAQLRSATLRQLGINYEVTLRGVQASVGVPFSTRSDEVVQAATLRLKYSYSPALLPDLSHLKISVNGVAVATIPTPKETAGRLLETDIQINPLLVTAYNQLDMQLIGHYTRDCEDPDHSSLWANIDRDSSLSLDATPLQLANDLSLLPNPFFDVRDTRSLQLPFYFPRIPDLDTVQAAGIVSSWLGTLASYRGAAFPVAVGGLPGSGNAVMFVTPSTLSPELLAADEGLGSVSGPSVAVVTNPNDRFGKLLLVIGRNAAELRTAATALALSTPMDGSMATIDHLDQPTQRKPYDAPRWISSERPVRFGDLVPESGQLSVSGYHPDLIRIGLQLPPDLFIWRRDGIPVTLKYRYTVPETNNKSALNISINESFVATLPLNGRPYAESLPRRWWNSLATRGKMPVEQKLTLPTGPFSSNSQLRFHFFFDRPQADECKNTFPDVSGAIDPDSSIDLSSFHHYIAMPNLAAFANAGYPFTRLADLSESAMVLPDQYREQDVSNVLTALGRLGAASGYPALNATIIRPADVARHADRDLMVFGSRSSQPLFRQWEDKLPITDTADARGFRISDWLLDRLPPFLSFDARRTDLPTTAEVSVRPSPGDVVLMGFESPLKPGRSVVAVLAEHAERVSGLETALADPELLKDFQGSVVLLQGKKVTSLAGNQTYYVGELPLPTWIRWYFSDHPLLLALLVIGLSLLLALAARVVLRRHSSARMQEGRKR